jgi:hypothetical protein
MSSHLNYKAAFVEVGGSLDHLWVSGQNSIQDLQDALLNSKTAALNTATVVEVTVTDNGPDYTVDDGTNNETDADLDAAMAALAVVRYP